MSPECSCANPESQSVAISQQGGHVITSRWAGDQTNSCVKNGLQTLNVASWKTNKNYVAVVQLTVYETGNESVQCMTWQRSLNGPGPKLSQCTITRRQHVVDVCPRRHTTVDIHTKISGWLDRMVRVVLDLDVSIRKVMTTAYRSAPDELRLQCIQLQPVVVGLHTPHVVEAP